MSKTPADNFIHSKKLTTERINTELVEIVLHAIKLRKYIPGLGRKTGDPYAVVTLIASDPKREKPRILGKTEILRSSFNPRWTTTFTTQFAFGRPNRINVGIYDDSSRQEESSSTTTNAKSNNNNRPTLMGSAVFEFGEILGSKAGQIQGKKLKDGGILFCRVRKALSIVISPPHLSLPSFDTNTKWCLETTNHRQVGGRLHLTIGGMNLKKNILGKKSSPFLEVSKKIGQDWRVVYRSEVVKENLFPKWKPFSIDLFQLSPIGAGDLQSITLQIACKDWGKNGTRETSMGAHETSVRELLHPKTKHSKRNDVFDLVDQKRGKHFGQVIVTKAVLDHPKDGKLLGEEQEATISREHQAPVSAMSNIPIVYAVTAEASPLPTTPVSNDSGPVGDALTERNLTTNQPPQTSINNANRGGPPSPVTSTTAVSSRPKFVDYLSGGMELEMSVAIDFTGSNGDPRRPGTLHYIHPDGSLNDYEKAITAVSEIVAKYDSDQKFPVLGFGAKYHGILQHCFPVGPNRESDGVKGIVDSYRSAFQTGFTMSGPTILAEVIQVAATEARERQSRARRHGEQCYHILLILTDGVVSDIPGTTKALNEASDAPLSIVIVGVGQADFSAMKFLDDFQESQRHGRLLGNAGRDICQFVEFSKYQDNKLDLTQATLDEIPDQVVTYFHDCNSISPLPGLHEQDGRVATAAMTPEEYNQEEEIDLTLEFNENGDTVQVVSGGIVDETDYGTYHNLGGGTNSPSNNQTPSKDTWYHNM